MIVRGDVFVRDRRFWTVQNFFHAQPRTTCAIIRSLCVFCQCSVSVCARTIHVCSTFISDTCAFQAWSVRVPCALCMRFISSFALLMRDPFVWQSLYMRYICAVYTQFIGNSDHAQPQKMTNFSTYNHAQTNFMRDFCVIHAWLAVGLGLKIYWAGTVKKLNRWIVPQDQTTLYIYICF